MKLTDEEKNELQELGHDQQEVRDLLEKLTAAEDPKGPPEGGKP
jgi:hypothetical protein